ncbi:MAG: hypothetical protein FJ096_16065 [Deltaproteobacteria bacterium]|nr:hypothetical protein [Deltaproteobacteria bacterium]
MSWFDKLLRQTPPPTGGSTVISRAMWACEGKLGLKGDSNRVSGEVEGFDVSVERDVLQLGADRKRAERLLLRARFPAKLDLGLRVSRSSKSDPRKPIFTGDPAFEKAFRALADDAERGQRLLASDVRELLLAGPETELTDSGVTVAIGESDASRVGEAVHYLFGLARAVDARRREVPCAEDLREFEAAWRATGQGYDLVIETTPLSARIDLGQVPTAVVAIRDGFGQFHFELTARFPRDLGVSLGLRPQSMNNEHNRELEPPGERAFDRLFAITARNVSVAPLFDMDVRAKLVALRNQGLQVRGNDRVISAWMGMRKEDLSAPVRHLWPLAEVAASIAQNVDALPSRST